MEDTLKEKLNILKNLNQRGSMLIGSKDVLRELFPEDLIDETGRGRDIGNKVRLSVYLPDDNKSLIQTSQLIGLSALQASGKNTKKHFYNASKGLIEAVEFRDQKSLKMSGVNRREARELNKIRQQHKGQLSTQVNDSLEKYGLDNFFEPTITDQGNVILGIKSHSINFEALKTKINMTSNEIKEDIQKSSDRENAHLEQISENLESYAEITKAMSNSIKR